MPVACADKWVLLHRRILDKNGYVFCVKCKKVPRKAVAPDRTRRLSAAPFSFDHAAAFMPELEKRRDVGPVVAPASFAPFALPLELSRAPLDSSRYPFGPCDLAKTRSMVGCGRVQWPNDIKAGVERRAKPGCVGDAIDCALRRIECLRRDQ